MPAITLKTFQADAVASAVRDFDHMRPLLDEAGDNEQNRASAIHGNGYLLIAAPPGRAKP